MRKKKIEKILKNWHLEFDKSKKNAKARLEINNLYRGHLKILIYGFGKNNEYSIYGELISDFIKQYGFNVSLVEQYLNNYDISILKNEVNNSDCFIIVCLNNDSIVAAIELLKEKDLNERKIWIFYPEEDNESFTYRNLAQQYGYNTVENLFSLESLKEFKPELPISLLNKSINLKWNEHREKSIKNILEINTSSIRVGIITALKKEFNAMMSLIEEPQFFKIKTGRTGKIYYRWTAYSLQGENIDVVLPLYSGKGNNLAAICATQLINDIPSIEKVIMVGIAGGIPNPQNPEEHVRLGDIVVSDEYGIIQYDKIKLVSINNLDVKPLHLLAKPSAELLNIAKSLEFSAISDNPPWKEYIVNSCTKLKENRPPIECDVLTTYYPKKEDVPHPIDEKRYEGLPRVFLGPIASGNIVLKDEKIRDRIRDLYNIMAVEMEGAGIMDAAWSLNSEYFVVRGICDYCNKDKNNIWQNYAAIVAAAFTRCLVELM